MWRSVHPIDITLWCNVDSIADIICVFVDMVNCYTNNLFAIECCHINVPPSVILRAVSVIQKETQFKSNLWKRDMWTQWYSGWIFWFTIVRLSQKFWVVVVHSDILRPATIIRLLILNYIKSYTQTSKNKFSSARTWYVNNNEVKSNNSQVHGNVKNW